MQGRLNTKAYTGEEGLPGKEFQTKANGHTKEGSQGSLCIRITEILLFESFSRGYPQTPGLASKGMKDQTKAMVMTNQARTT
jgi:hypothetical protein